MESYHSQLMIINVNFKLRVDALGFFTFNRKNRRRESEEQKKSITYFYADIVNNNINDNNSIR